MISMTKNHTGVPSVTKNLSDMSLAELTKEYNVLAAKAGKKGVKKLRDAKSGLNKIEALRKTSPSSPKKSDTRSKISQEFGCRAGTNLERLVEALGSSLGKAVTRSDLLKAVYGSQKAENVGPLAMVQRGVLASIKKGRLPYLLERSRDAKTKEVSLALLAK